MNNIEIQPILSFNLPMSSIMPYQILPSPIFTNLFIVKNPVTNAIHSYHTTLENANKQIRYLKSLEAKKEKKKIKKNKKSLLKV